jgi:chromate transporter
VLAHGWLSEGELLDMIAVAESTPGPIAVNMATFIGSAKGGIFGAMIATLGVVLPSFLIILLIAAVMQRLMRYAPVKAFLGGLRPAVVGLILSTALLLLLGTVFGISSFATLPSVDLRGLVILLFLVFVSFLFKRLFRRTASPILLIALSAVLGVVFYGVLGRL